MISKRVIQRIRVGDRVGEWARQRQAETESSVEWSRKNEEMKWCFVTCHSHRHRHRHRGSCRALPAAAGVLETSDACHLTTRHSVAYETVYTPRTRIHTPVYYAS
jgi:hypothetical protein